MEESLNIKQCPLLDPEQITMLLEACADDSSDLFSEILTMFEEESQHKLADLRQSSSSGDYEKMGRAAHALSGSSANIGGREVWLRAKEMENLCKSGNGAQAAGMLNDLELIYAETIVQLRYFVSQLGA